MFDSGHPNAHERRSSAFRNAQRMKVPHGTFGDGLAANEIFDRAVGGVEVARDFKIIDDVTGRVEIVAISFDNDVETEYVRSDVAALVVMRVTPTDSERTGTGNANQHGRLTKGKGFAPDFGPAAGGLIARHVQRATHRQTFSR